MKLAAVIVGWLIQVMLFMAMAYGILIVGGPAAMGWFLILTPIPMSMCGFFNVNVKWSDDGRRTR